MSIKNKLQSLCKLYPFYEELPVELLGEIDVDSWFDHNIYDISQSQHRIARLSKIAKKTSFAVELFHFCDLKTQQRFILQHRKKFSKKHLVLSSTVSACFWKVLIKRASAYRINYWSPKLRLNLQIRTTVCSLFTPKGSLNIQILTFVSRSAFETKNLAVITSKSLRYTVISSYLHKLSTLTFPKFTTTHKNRYQVPNKCEVMESNCDV